jgi:hypothetical protein
MFVYNIKKGYDSVKYKFNYVFDVFSSLTISYPYGSHTCQQILYESFLC